MRLIGKIDKLNMPNVTFAIDGDFKTGEELRKLEGKELVLEISKYYEKKSLSANGYFWALVREISIALGSSKDDVYKWLLRDGGVHVHLEVKREAVPMLERTFRLIEEVGTHSSGSDEFVEVLAYYGVSTYNTKEMHHLIDLTRQEAKRLGIDVWTDEEVKRVLGEQEE